MQVLSNDWIITHSLYPAPPAVRSAEDAAGPAAGAALAPEADPDTPAPGPGPTPDRSPVLPRPPRRPRTSPTPVPDLDPDPHPNPSPGPEAAPLPPKEPPGRDPKARPSQQQRMEANPLRSHHPSHRWVFQKCWAFFESKKQPIQKEFLWCLEKYFQSELFYSFKQKLSPVLNPQIFKNHT